MKPSPPRNPNTNPTAMMPNPTGIPENNATKKKTIITRA